MNRLKDYLELIRFPNLFTATADITAGVFIVSQGWDLVGSYPFLLLLLASASLYAMGTTFNDYFDYDEDLIERPERPLPSGRVRHQTALGLGVVFGILGVLLSLLAGATSAIISVVLAIFILLYDRWTKHYKYLGPLTMGACRSINLLLGMSLVTAQLSNYWWISALALIYIVTVTSLAAGETGEEHHPYRVGIAGGGYLICLLFIPVFVDFSEHPVAGILALALFLIWCLYGLWPALLQPTPPMIRRAVGKGVIGIVLLDATITAPFAGILAMVFVTCFLVISQIFSRMFAVT